jgi:hypothetical protein
VTTKSRPGADSHSWNGGGTHSIELNVPVIKGDRVRDIIISEDHCRCKNYVGMTLDSATGGTSYSLYADTGYPGPSHYMAPRGHGVLYLDNSSKDAYVGQTVVDVVYDYNEFSDPNVEFDQPLWVGVRFTGGAIAWAKASSDIQDDSPGGFSFMYIKDSESKKREIKSQKRSNDADDYESESNCKSWSTQPKKRLRSKSPKSSSVYLVSFYLLPLHPPPVSFEAIVSLPSE